jgi:hypothetical protein
MADALPDSCSPERANHSLVDTVNDRTVSDYFAILFDLLDGSAECDSGRGCVIEGVADGAVHYSVSTDDLVAAEFNYLKPVC